MRIQISIPSDLWEKLQDLAHAWHRTPRQQVEFMIHQAVAETETFGRERVRVEA